VQAVEVNQINQISGMRFTSGPVLRTMLRTHGEISVEWAQHPTLRPFFFCVTDAMRGFEKIMVREKKRGRPATGLGITLTTRVPPEIAQAVDLWAEANGATRSKAVRQLIEIGLTAPPRKFRQSA
jgi:hypothetical protein